MNFSLTNYDNIEQVCVFGAKQKSTILLMWFFSFFEMERSRLNYFTVLCSQMIKCRNGKCHNVNTKQIVYGQVIVEQVGVTLS